MFWILFLDTFTTGNSIYTECPVVCQVHSFGHSANNIFTECLQINTRRNNCTRQKLIYQVQEIKHSANNNKTLDKE